jgi:hypothetical protein
MGGSVAGVDLGDHQRHVLVHPPVARVVDDDGARGDDPRGPLGADRSAGGGDHDVEALDRLLGQLPALDLAAGERQSLARRARGGERDQLGDRELALGEHLEDRRADRAGRTDDPDPVGRRGHQAILGR